MSLRSTLLLFTALLLVPAVAHAAPKKHAVQKPPVARHGLGAAAQLTAMTTAIAASPSYWSGLSSECNVVTPLLASAPGNVMAGNFRDARGNCYVWMNLQQSSVLTGSEICKTTLHEVGHLNGLQHSSNPLDVMFSPFVSDPVPGACRAAGARWPPAFRAVSNVL